MSTLVSDRVVCGSDSLHFWAPSLFLKARMGGRIRVLPKSNHVAFAVPEIRIPARRGNRHPASYRLAALMYYSTRCTHLQG